METQDRSFFPLTSEHIERRAKLSPLARLIHEILLSDTRTHEPESWPVQMQDIINIIQFKYNVKTLPTYKMVCKEFYNLIDSELVVNEGNGYQCKISFEDDDIVKSLLARIRAEIDPEFREPTLKKVLVQSSQKEVEKQLECFKYRNNTWHESRIVMFCSYCRDFVPPPKSMEERKKEVDKKQNEMKKDALKKKYDAFFDAKIKEFLQNTPPEQIEKYKELARHKAGHLYTKDDCRMFEALLRNVIIEHAGIPKFEEWSKNE